MFEPGLCQLHWLSPANHLFFFSININEGENAYGAGEYFQINQSKAMQSAVFQILDNCPYNDLRFGYVSVNDPTA